VRSHLGSEAANKWFWFSYIGFVLQTSDEDLKLKVAVPSKKQREALAELQKEVDCDLLDCALWRFVNRGQPFDTLTNFWAKFLSDLEVLMPLAAEEYQERVRSGYKSETWNGTLEKVDVEWRRRELEKCR
jgi:hypothetical protein